MLFTAVVLPMLYSYICFIPLAFIQQVFCMILPNLISKVFLGIFIIIATMMITQTKMNTFYFPSFYIIVVQDLDMLLVKIVSSVVLVLLFWGVGTKLLKKYIQTFAIS